MYDFMFAVPTADERLKAWSRQLDHEVRSLGLQITRTEREEQKVKMQIRQMVKKGDNANARILARSVLQSRKAVARLYAAKASIGSMKLAIRQQHANLRVSKSLQVCTQAMSAVNQMIRIPELRATAMQLGKEMARAGFIEEMVDGVLNIDDDQVEEEADELVDAVLQECMPSPSARVPTGAKAAARTVSDADVEAMIALERIRQAAAEQ